MATALEVLKSAVSAAQSSGSMPMAQLLSPALVEWAQTHGGQSWNIVERLEQAESEIRRVAEWRQQVHAANAEMDALQQKLALTQADAMAEYRRGVEAGRAEGMRLAAKVLADMAEQA